MLYGDPQVYSRYVEAVHNKFGRTDKAYVPLLGHLNTSTYKHPPRVQLLASVLAGDFA
jgi:hypothetical protein